MQVRGGDTNKTTGSAGIYQGMTRSGESGYIRVQKRSSRECVVGLWRAPVMAFGVFRGWGRQDLEENR